MAPFDCTVVAKAWDTRKNAMLFTMPGHVDTITGLSLSKDGKYILSNAMDNTVRAWDVRPFVSGSRNVKVRYQLSLP